MPATVLSALAIAGSLVLLAVVGLERNRLKHRLDRAEGAVAGLTLDLEATRERVTELQTYLGRQDSWAVDAEAPAPLADPRTPDRWSPPAPTPHGGHEAAPARTTTPVAPKDSAARHLTNG